MTDRPASAQTNQSRAWLGGLCCGLATLLLMLATETRLAIVWDEAYTLSRLDRLRAWFSALANPEAAARSWPLFHERPLEDTLRRPSAADIRSRANLFAPGTLAWHWPFAREEPHGHPPFYAIVALVGDLLPIKVSELTRARLVSMLVFSFASGTLYWFIRRRWGLAAGMCAAGAWALHPHLFALGHYATYDGLLASLWLASTLAFACATQANELSVRPRIRWGAALAFGVLAGCAAATKLTGWLLPVPLILWTLLMRDRRGFITLLLGGAIAMATFYCLCPPLWSNPLAGMSRFLESNLSRAKTIPIKTQFLGRVYETPSGSLPWYNTLVWLVLATPVGFLVLGATGAVRAVRRIKAEPEGLLFVLSCGCVLVVRALPHTPGHDGTRQLATALGGLAPLAGLGVASVCDRFARAVHWVVAAVLIEGATSVFLMMPVPLSYYSPLVGGLPGAAALGMEPTYYWDSLTNDALGRLDDRTPAGRTVFFASNPITWQYKQSQRLHAGIYPFDGLDYAWYVVQNRPGSMSAATRRLVNRLGARPEFVLTEKFGVPLAWSFPASEVEAETHESGRGPELR